MNEVVTPKRRGRPPKVRKVEPTSTATPSKRSYGWKPQLPDFRDHMFSVTHRRTLPAATDLRPGMPPVYDQGDLGSCTANAAAGMFQYDETAQGKSQSIGEPSRLFIYYCERGMMHTISQDSGSSLRDAAKVLAKIGVCSERTWPYIVDKFTDKPPQEALVEAGANKAAAYTRIDNADIYAIKAVLASGYPIMFGFTVYDSFESDQVARTGIVPMPAKTEQVLGGHAVVIAGYDDTKKMFLVRNSWGPAWGIGGYCWFPYDYLTNKSLASDFWKVTL